MDHESKHAAQAGGLAPTLHGYTLELLTTELDAAKNGTYEFRITGPDGRAVTGYTASHGKALHLIWVRRDLSGYRHLHPAMAADGTWSVSIEPAEPGGYRVFTDFLPAGHSGDAITLGADVTVTGDYRPLALPAQSRTAVVDGYAVALDGDLHAGRAAMLTLSVAVDGVAVTDLQPYLGAYGHLVALRSGDLGYLHVHPQGEPGDGVTKPGPAISFHAAVPTPGAYRLYLDFQHGGVVRTAEFTATAD